MSDSLNTEIRIDADATGVEAGVSRAKRSLADLGATAKRAGAEAAEGVAGIGEGGEQSSRKVERATKSMAASLERLIALQRSGSRESREYWEVLASQRGVNLDAIKPLLDQLDQARQKTRAAKEASDAWAASLGRQRGAGALDPLLGQFDQVRLKTSAAKEASDAWAASLGKITPILSTVAAAFSVREVSSAVDAWKNLNAQLNIATGSMRGGAEAYRATLDNALLAGQAIDQVGTVYRRFAENSMELGISQQKVADLTRTVSQSIAISGGSAQAAQASLTQFGQALASGALRGEELNSVLEQAPALARALAAGLGISVGQLRNLAAEGRITSEEIVRALDNQAERIAANFEKLPLTMTRALENMRTRWVDVMGGFESSSGAFGQMAEAVDAAARNLDVLVVAGAAIAALYGGRMAGAIAVGTAAKLADVSATLRQVQATEAASIAAHRYTGLMLSQSAAVSAAAAGMTASATAAAAAGGLARSALTALGGPVGAVTTVLTLGATAWMLWGSRADEATKEAATSATEHLDSVIEKITEMNSRLAQFGRRSYDNTVAGAESELKTTRAEIARLQNTLDAMDTDGGRGRFTTAGRRMQEDLNALSTREISLQEQVAEARRRAAEVGTGAIRQFVEANAVGAEKVALQQRKMLADFSAAIEKTGGVFDFGDANHAAALTALNAALADADKEAGKSAAALLKEQYANRLATIKESLAAEDGLLRIARARGELDERAYLDRLGEAQRESFAARAAVLRDQLAAADKSSDRERILGDVRALGAEAAKAAGEATLAYVELDKAARATLATLTSEAWGEVGQFATDNTALREELVTLGMTTRQLDEYRRQKTLAARESANEFADALEAAAAAIDDEGEAAQRARQYYLDLAAARRAAAEQLGERATLERQLATSREALRLSTESAKVWQDGWQETDRIARDAFVAWADDGASAAERIGQSLRSALLSAIYEATLRPIALQVYTTAAGALGLSGGAAGAGAGSNLLGMASNAKSLYDLASGDYGLYGSFATSQYGQALGLSTAPGVYASSIGTGSSLGFGGLFADGATGGTAAGASASMSTLGSALPWAAGGGILAGILYDGKGQSAAGGAIGAGVGYAAAAGSGWAAGASMGSAAGPIGAIAGAIIGGFLGSKIGGGGERFKTTYGSASGLYDDGRYTSTGAWQGGRQYGDDVDQVLDRATQAFSAR
ncbi:MAG: tape measure protein, partial [Rhodocyclaceae bacterium]|nr:tape measure protein [Rhodocyclaceae bacterium]